MLSDETLEARSLHQYMDVGWTLLIGGRKMGLETVGAGSIGDDGRPVGIVITARRTGLPDLNPGTGNGAAIGGRSDRTPEKIARAKARTHG